MRYTGKAEAGNKLEQSVYKKLLSSLEMIRLKIDSLMFYHVYADLVMLSKSTILAKSVTDMNIHYLELSLFLQEAIEHPEIILNKDYNVFRSEKQLYGDNKKVNFRLRSKLQCVFNYLFSSESEYDLNTVYQCFTSGAAKMREKLCSYAGSQLPGGEYWDPEPNIRKELDKLKPSNDICESILGLNDYLTTALPNLHQVSRSNLVQAKKIKLYSGYKD